MKRLALILALLPVSAAAVPVEVPSGRAVKVLDVVLDAPGAYGATARFRFVAPGLEAATDRAAIEQDMEYLCHSYALPQLPEGGAGVDQVIISLSAQALEFGQTAPDVTQFFEAYRPENGRCIWEGF